MMRTSAIGLTLTALLAAAVFGVVSPASACGTYGGTPWVCSSCVHDSPPYYAVHPPVYYSRPIARPYGLSPYPSPPVVIVVAYREPVHRVEDSPKPLRIKNPFPDQPDSPPPADDPAKANALPRIVYPVGWK